MEKEIIWKAGEPFYNSIFRAYIQKAYIQKGFDEYLETEQSLFDMDITNVDSIEKNNVIEL